MARKKKAAKPKLRELVIPPTTWSTIYVTIYGELVVMHKFSEKAKAMMRAKQQKHALNARQAKNPEECFNGARYINDEGLDYIPAVNLKCSIAAGAKGVEGCAMTDARKFIRVTGETHREEMVIKYDELSMREDVVRNATGVCDLRYRPEYTNFSFNAVIKFDSGVFSAEQVLKMLTKAGECSGLGEWRQEKGGIWGHFSVKCASIVEERAA